MSSILKVDQLQDSGGNSIITSDGAGNITPGSLNIANAQIASNAAIATTKLGTGALLQAQTFVTTGNTTSTTSTSYTDTVNTISITPLSSNSKILVFADHAVAISQGSSNQRCDIRIFETATSTTVTDKRYIGKDGTGGKLDYQIGLSGGFTNSSTAQKTFKVQVRKANGTASESGNIELNWYNNALHTMMAIEVQA
jgi:hypothetical protein